MYHRVEDGEIVVEHHAKPGVLYMGVELEIVKMEDKIYNFLASCNLGQELLVYFKEDASIGYDGAELVTMPITIDAFDKLFPFDALDTARAKGARSFEYQSCGFHIHVARSAFSPTHMWKFIKFQMLNPLLCQRIAQREESSYATWFYDTHERKDLPEYVKGKKANGRRYLAINFQNHATVELRYFKGNILRKAIMKNLEFVQSLYEYTKELTVRDVTQGALSESSYLSWLEQQNGYENLKYYINAEEI
jgi:hypothetical protein